MRGRNRLTSKIGILSRKVNNMKDGFFQGKAHGSVAQQLMANGMNINALRTNDTLRKDEWKKFDERLVKVAQERLVAVADLRARNLVYRVPNGMGTTVLQYEDVSDIEGAQLSMDAVTRGKNDRPEFDIHSLPLPIIHKDWQINIRVLSASRTLGQPLDTTMAELAARKVAELQEEHLISGISNFKYASQSVYGYLNAPNRNTVTLTKNWDDATKTGENILDDVKSMKQASIDARFFGPWVMYIPTAYETVLDDDFKSASDKTIRQRILEVSGIQSIKVADKLTANNVLMVQMSSDVVRLVEGLPLTMVEWKTEGNMIFHFKVMTIVVPQIRADQEGHSGITHLAA